MSQISPGKHRRNTPLKIHNAISFNSRPSLHTRNHKPYPAHRYNHQERSDEPGTSTIGIRGGLDIPRVVVRRGARGRVPFACAAGGVRDQRRSKVYECGLNDGERGHLLADARGAVVRAVGGPMLPAGCAVGTAAVEAR